MAEEVVVNIVVYAYPDASSDGVGGDDYLDVELMRDGNSITLRFRDGGVPFNLLEKELLDTSHRDERSGSKIGI